MFDYKRIVNSINQILSEVNGQLLEEQVADISSLSRAGEWRLAVETLCDNLYGQDIKISETAYEVLKEVGTTLNLGASYWETLKP